MAFKLTFYPLLRRVGLPLPRRLARFRRLLLAVHRAAGEDQEFQDPHVCGAGVSRLGDLDKDECAGAD